MQWLHPLFPRARTLWTDTGGFPRGVLVLLPALPRGRRPGNDARAAPDEPPLTPGGSAGTTRNPVACSSLLAVEVAQRRPSHALSTREVVAVQSLRSL